MKKQIYPFLDKEYPITQTYAENPGSYAQFGQKGHNGIDYATPTGTPVMAGLVGTVTRVKYDPKGYGLHVQVTDFKQQIAVNYAHLKSWTQPEGKSVTQTDIIGHTDSTGNSTGPHLHFAIGETDINGNRINQDNGYSGWLDPQKLDVIGIKMGGNGSTYLGIHTIGEDITDRPTTPPHEEPRQPEQQQETQNQKQQPAEDPKEPVQEGPQHQIGQKEDRNQPPGITGLYRRLADWMDAVRQYHNLLVRRLEEVLKELS